FDFGGDQLDATLGFAARHAVHRGDLHRAIVLDVDAGAGFFGDGTDDRTALADNFADLLRVDLDGDDGRRPLGHLRARLADHLVHFIQDVQAAGPGLAQRHFHDLAGDAVDLDVHLQRGHARAGTGHLEVH